MQNNYLPEKEHGILCRLLLKLEANAALPRAIRRTAKGLYNLITRYHDGGYVGQP